MELGRKGVAEDLEALYAGVLEDGGRKLPAENFDWSNYPPRWLASRSESAWSRSFLYLEIKHPSKKSQTTHIKLASVNET